MSSISDRDGRPAGECLDGSAQALVAEQRRVETAGELAQLVERERELDRRRGRGPRERRRDRSRAASPRAEGTGQRDQALLRAVVQVPLEPASLDVAGGDDPARDAASSSSRASELGVQPVDLASCAFRSLMSV